MNVFNHDFSSSKTLGSISYEYIWKKILNVSSNFKLGLYLETMFFLPKGNYN